MLEVFTHDEGAKLMTILATGGFVGWFREYRKGKKDANNFALEFMQTQSGRIDALVRELAEVKADHRMAQQALDMMREECDNLRHDIALRDIEIDRLKTALQANHTKGTP